MFGSIESQNVNAFLNFSSRFNMDNNMDGLYIAPAFIDKVVVHITKNFLNLPNIKVD